MIYTSLDNFYLSPEEVEASPSRGDGVDVEQEDQLRRFGCDQIQRAVVLLGQPQGVAVTAQILLHRFYCRRSLKSFDVKVTCIAAFWLAAKLEEVIEIDSPGRLRLRDVVQVFYRLSLRASGLPPEPLDPGSMRYAELKAAVVRDERHMLRALGFVIAAEQPHRFVLNYGALVLGASAAVQQEAWNLANDSLRTTLCLTLRPEVVACGILFLAARRLRLPLPESPPWWQPLGATTRQVHAVAATLHALYQKPPASYLDLRAPAAPRRAAAGEDDGVAGLHISEPDSAGLSKEGERAAAPASDPGSNGRAAQSRHSRSRERRREHSRERRRDDSKRRRHADR